MTGSAWTQATFILSIAQGYARDMGKVYSEIGEALAAWIEEQHLFFVASALLAADGHVNVSPKGDLRWFRIIGPREVAYSTSSAAGRRRSRTRAENGRIVVMFCAFDGPPRIVRLHGRAALVPPGDDGFDELLEPGAFAQPAVAAARSAR